VALSGRCCMFRARVLRRPHTSLCSVPHRVPPAAVLHRENRRRDSPTVLSGEFTHALSLHIYDELIPYLVAGGRRVVAHFALSK
jgi:hypothetical protein